uniref:Ribosomal protein S6 n=1 Tax=Kalanchoe fedtschenkoi TaxID=63787 RepID=A0A7N0UEM9_KALFE
MESLLQPHPSACITSKLPQLKQSSTLCAGKWNPRSLFPDGCSSKLGLYSRNESGRGLGKLAIAAAKKKPENGKEKSDSYVVRPDESTGPFPEAVLLKQKKVQEDGRLLPEFEDAEEAQLFQMLNLQLESDLEVERMRHYEVVYMIHEKYAEEVEKVNEKVQDFLREKKGRTWRVSDWGMRRLAYKIQKASRAHYMLMNFELEAKWINEFKELLDKDERVIRHLVIKRDEAITEDCPPPPEFHTLRAVPEDEDDEDDDVEYYDGEEDDEEWDDEEEEEENEEGADSVIVADSDEYREDGSSGPSQVTGPRGRNLTGEKVLR